MSNFTFGFFQNSDSTPEPNAESIEKFSNKIAFDSSQKIPILVRREKFVELPYDQTTLTVNIGPGIFYKSVYSESLADNHNDLDILPGVYEGEMQTSAFEAPYINATATCQGERKFGNAPKIWSNYC